MHTGFFKTSVALGLLCAAAIVQGAAIPNTNSPSDASALDSRAESQFKITVYQNSKCTGQAIPFSGSSEECHNGLGSGGAGVQLFTLSGKGKLVFYDKLDCPGSARVAGFNSTDQPGKDCKNLEGNPVSFKFENA